MTVHVNYRQREGGTWIATTPDIPKLRIVADSYDEARGQVEEVVRFALNTAHVDIRHDAAD